VLVAAAAVLLQRRHLALLLGPSVLIPVMVFALALLAAWFSASARRGLGRALNSKVIAAVASIPLVLWLISAIYENREFLPTTPSNVILIGIDTIRSDHTTLRSADEYVRDLTPELCRNASSQAVLLVCPLFRSTRRLRGSY
jgi:hypothetical protein